jgi:hypothetical protein
MAIITLTWQTTVDDRTCKICKALNGYTWVFDTSRGDVMIDALFHPSMGIVWSLEQGSNAHAHGYLSGQTNNCRCRMHHTIDAEDVLAKSVYLAEIIKDIANDQTDTSLGSRRTTTFEDIGIDPSKYGFE